jgi:hypothetical protein
MQMAIRNQLAPSAWFVSATSRGMPFMHDMQVQFSLCQSQTLWWCSLAHTERQNACDRRHKGISHEGVRSDSQTLRSAADIKGEVRAKLCQNRLIYNLQAIGRLRRSTTAGVHITAACCNAGWTAS